MLSKCRAILVVMSLLLLPLPLPSPWDQRYLPHDHSRSSSLRPDEIHTNHSSQIVHAHFVNSTVQLDFMEEPVGSQDIPEWEIRSCHKYFQVPTRSQRYVSTLSSWSQEWDQSASSTEFGFVSKESRSRKTRNKQPQLLRVV